MTVTIRPNRKSVTDPRYMQSYVLNKSNHSYNTNRKIVEVLNSNSWLGRRCFILAGGPSTSNFDYSKLDNELTIGINRSFQLYSKATINYSMDSTFYQEMKDGKLNEVAKCDLWKAWLAYSGIRIFLTPMERKQYGQEVYLVRRDWRKQINRTDLCEGIWGGTNSGTGAIMLAIALGATQIYLLGYDLKTSGSKTHNHSGYPKRDVEEFNAKLLEYRDEISNIRNFISGTDIDIINLNRNSALTCYRFDDLERILQ